jgi:pilus assembly protein CpaB
MNKRFVSVLIFAFLVAGGASLLLYRLTVNNFSAKAAAPASALVAAHNLDVGVLIHDPDIKSIPWPGPMPANAIKKKEDIIGRGVINAIYDGELIVENRLAPKGAGGGLAGMIPSGMRAVAVRVNDVVGVAGFVIPGMRVDILISGAPPGSNGSSGTLTRTLLQNIEVLSAGQDYKKDSEGKPVMVQVVNLLVTPAQAEMLSLAANQTTIQLVLRNPMDRQAAKTSGTTVGQLFGGMAEPKAPSAEPARVTAAPRPVRLPDRPAPPPPFVVEVLNGAARTQSSFVVNPEVK